jgi:hypothetical protein
MVPVNNRPLAVSSVSGPGTYTFRKDSAGLGVPRDAFGELKHISSDVVRHGQVNTEVERSVIGPSPAFAHRDANGNPNFNGNRGSYGHDGSLGSRSVATFSRPNADAHGNADMNAGWSGLSRGSMRSPDAAGSPMSRQPSMPRAQSSAPAPQGSSSQASAGASHK